MWCTAGLEHPEATNNKLKKTIKQTKQKKYFESFLFSLLLNINYLRCRSAVTLHPLSTLLEWKWWRDGKKYISWRNELTNFNKQKIERSNSDFIFIFKHTLYFHWMFGTEINKKTFKCDMTWHDMKLIGAYRQF